MTLPMHYKVNSSSTSSELGLSCKEQNTLSCLDDISFFDDTTISFFAINYSGKPIRSTGQIIE
jgi:hypothetical protein